MSHVVVVDDDRAIRDLLTFALESEGYDVITLSNGVEVANVLVSITEPCVVLLDLMMPRMDGWAVCRMLEERSEVLAQHSVIVMTASLLDGDLCPPPAKALLRKPFELDKVYQMIASLLATPAAAPVIRAERAHVTPVTLAS